MRRCLRRIGLPLVGACGMLLGCQQTHASRFPPDPLLLSKKPVESRPGHDPAPAVAHHEPPAPPVLVVALAQSETDATGPGRVPVAPASLRHDGEER